jgi:hypothetical protein
LAKDGAKGESVAQTGHGVAALQRGYTNSDSSFSDRRQASRSDAMNPFALLAPLFLIFEVWQLVVSERYMGVKQIRVNADPRELPMPRWMSIVWAGGLLFYFAWMFSLLLHPVGRAQGFVLIAMTAVGYALRTSCGIKWVLVVLTFEGAIRIGMLVSLFASSWRRLMM